MRGCTSVQEKKIVPACRFMSVGQFGIIWSLLPISVTKQSLLLKIREGNIHGVGTCDVASALNVLSGAVLSSHLSEYVRRLWFSC